MKKIIMSVVMILSVIIAPIKIFAMTTYDFDIGMSKGIEYFNKGLYYEAKDEFQWFCDYNWGNMNDGQQKYALDYLGSAKAKIAALESQSYCYVNSDIPDYTKITGRENFGDVNYYDNQTLREYRYRYWTSEEATTDVRKYLTAAAENGWRFEYDEEYGDAYMMFWSKGNIYTGYNVMAISVYYEGGYMVSVAFPN